MELAQELVDSGDPAAKRAIFDSPAAALDGLHEDGRQRLKNRALRQEFPDRVPVDEIETLERAHERAAENVQRAQSVIKRRPDSERRHPKGRDPFSPHPRSSGR